MKRCVVCGQSLPEKSRSDRRTCSPKCRVSLSRRLRLLNRVKELAR